MATASASDSTDNNGEAGDQCRLYLITPAAIPDLEAFEGALETALSAGDVACLQVRLKDTADDEIIRIGKRLKVICDAHDVALLINDSAELAKAIDADGVHLGQSDGDVASARTLLGHEASIGVTCHDSMHLAFEAGDAGADYVAFGAFYPTDTKETTHRPPIDILSKWDEVTELPAVAIGGITPDNAEALVRAGAHFLAVSAAVWNHAAGPGAAVKAFNDIFARVGGGD